MASSTKILRALGAFGTGALLGGGSVAAVLRTDTVVADSSSAEPEPKHPTVLKYGAPVSLTSGVYCYSNHCLEFDPSRRNGCQFAEITLLEMSSSSYRLLRAKVCTLQQLKYQFA